MKNGAAALNYLHDQDKSRRRYGVQTASAEQMLHTIIHYRGHMGIEGYCKDLHSLIIKVLASEEVVLDKVYLNRIIKDEAFVRIVKKFFETTTNKKWSDVYDLSTPLLVEILTRKRWDILKRETSTHEVVVIEQPTVHEMVWR